MLAVTSHPPVPVLDAPPASSVTPPTPTGARWRSLLPTGSPGGAAAWSAAVYAVLAVLLFRHVWVGDPTRASLPSGDPYSTMWFLRWIPFAIAHGQNPFFSGYANAPYGVNLLTNTSVPLLGLLIAPVTVVWGPIVSFNVLMTVAPAASAAAAYALARRFTGWWPAAFVAGLLYGFSPYEVAQSLGHLNLTFVAVPPLVLLAVHELVVRQARPARRWGIGLGLLLVAQFFIASEVLASTAVVTAVAVLATAVVGRRSLRAHLRHALVGGAWAAGTAGALLAYPVWFALSGPAHIRGPIQLVPQVYRAALVGPVVPDSLMRFAPASATHVADHFANSLAENGSYLGAPLVLILVVAVIALWRSAPAIRVVAVTGAAAFVLSLGAGLVVSGAPSQIAGGIPLPERALAALPVLSNTIPVRYSLYVALAAALGLAIAMDRMRSRLLRPPSRRVRRRREPPWRALMLPIALGAVALVPLVPAGPIVQVGPVVAPPFFTSATMDALVPPGSVAVLYPFPTSLNVTGKMWQAASGFRFRMPGGDFLVPDGPDGEIAFHADVPSSPGIGYTRATLTAAVLSAVAKGTPPAETASLRASVLAEWSSWHVRTLIALPDLGPRPGRAVAFLTWLVGRPPRMLPGTVAVWAGLDQ